MNGKTELLRGFENPSSAFSPMPFWFWNDDLSEKEMKSQILQFHEKGINGFVIHPRIGLPENIAYMGDAWMHYVRVAVQEAKQLGMQVILYDEAMYPSGSCHGGVVKTNAGFASKCLEMRETPDQSCGKTLVAQIENNSKKYYVYECFSGGTIRGIHYGEDDGETNAPKSADLLNHDAVACFIQLTHEKYFRALKDYFGNTIVGIFTDEPMICGRVWGKVPWTTGLLKVLEQKGFEEKDLLYLFQTDDSPNAKRAKRIFASVIRERLQDSFYKPISKWCKEHGIAFLGHPEKSTDIELLQYFDIPCQDIVWRCVAPGNESGIVGPHSTLAKCASDSARHRGKRRNGNECFGCCGHEDDPYLFTYEDMKWYLDWLFVLGCNLIIPHAFFYALREKRQEERPPDVGINSTLWKDYKKISDYIKRCCEINTDSVNITDIAILCSADDLPWKAAKELYESQIEFNYLEYDLLKECVIRDSKCQIAKNEYKILIIDGIYDSESEAFLQKFKEAGGILIEYAPCKNFAEQVRKCSSTAIKINTADRNLRITHIHKNGVDLLFCVNEGETQIKAVINEKISCVMDAETGTVTSLNTNEFTLSLLPRKSLYIILDRE